MPQALRSLKSLVPNSPPVVLYHYTTQAGLLGIFKSKEIWATKIQYLNDTSEFTLALDLARESLDTRRKWKRYKNRRRLLNSLASHIDIIANTNVCVCSFSEIGDSLSQWRGYGGSVSSFSIGFSSSMLKAAAKGAKCDLVKCIYDPDTQREAIDELIDTTLDDLIQSNTLVPKEDFNILLTRLAPVMKNRSFRDEREWRLISERVSAYDPQFDIRSGTSTPLPYYKIPLPEDYDNPVPKLIVGPCPHMDLAHSSVQMISFATELDIEHIIDSQIPYRNW